MSMTPHLLLQEMTREEAGAVAPQALVVFPVGAVEQHGPHLPVGTDYFTVEHVSRAAAAQVAEQIPVVVAPTLPFGSSHHHLPFGGTMSLSTETYYKLVYELAETLIISGFRRVFIVNGHGGNHELVQLVARDLTLKYEAHLAAGSYWNIAWDAVAEAGREMPGGLPGHAGIYETSQILALRPELVHEPRPHRDLAAPYVHSPVSPYRSQIHGFWQSINGFTDSPDQADAAQGQRYLDAVVRGVAHALVEFYRAAESA